MLLTAELLIRQPAESIKKVSIDLATHGILRHEMALAPKRPKGRDSNIVPGKAEGTWDVNVQLLMPNGKRWTARRKGLKTKLMARTVRDDLYAAFNLQVLGIREETGRASSAGATLESWLKHCIDELWPVSVPQSVRGYENACRNWILPHFPNKPIKDLTPLELRGCMDHLAQVRSDLSVNSLKGAKTALSSALTLAVEHGHIPTNPFSGIRIPWRAYQRSRTAAGRTEAQKIILSRSEVEAIADHLESHGSLYFPVFLLQGLLGLRLGEALALKRTDFNFQREEVRITRQLKRIARADGTTHLAVVPPKTASGLRTIPCPERVVALAEASRDLLCPGLEGGWLDIDNVSKRMAREVRELGFPGFHSHSLRHSFVSYLLNEMKVPVSVVKQIAGHSSIQTTLTYYSVATDRQLREAMNGMSSIRKRPAD